MIVAISIDLSLKSQSIETFEISKSQRNPIYAGFFAAQVGKQCGEITFFSTKKMETEMNLPILSIITIPKNPVELVLCKWGKMIEYGASGSLWLRYYKSGFLLQTVFFLETVAVYALKFFIVFICFFQFSKKPLYLVTISILFAYIFIHTFFEIQPRYFISPLVYCSLLFCLQKPIAFSKVVDGK